MPYREQVDLHATAIADLLPCSKDERVCFWLCPSVSYSHFTRTSPQISLPIGIGGQRKVYHRINWRPDLLGCLALGFLLQEILRGLQFQDSDRLDFRQYLDALQFAIHGPTANPNLAVQNLLGLS